MATYDKKFEVIRPSLDRLIRESGWTMNDPTLLDPTNAAAVIDGEFLQLTTGTKLIRVTDAAKPSWVLFEDRGDMGVQVHKRPTLLSGHYFAQTIVYAATVQSGGAIGGPLCAGAVNTTWTGSQARTGLILRTGSELILGYITVVPTTAGAPLTFMSTLA